MAIIIKIMIFTNETLSQGEIIRTLGSRFRDYRMRMNFTRKEIAERTGLSMTTLYKLETGNLTDMSMGTMLKLLRAVGQYGNWDKLLPELPESPYLYKEDFTKKQRIRHPKK
ncbi:MAG: helix-turn-helix domain-containing protein [Muribaculaceae bacterium]|nr:helix-turn-helix domain-containing protein [Muribaculaceae bacterium]